MIGIRHCVDNPPVGCCILFLLSTSQRYKVHCLQFTLLCSTATSVNRWRVEKTFCCLSKTFTLTSQKIKSLGMTHRNFWKWAPRAPPQTTLILCCDPRWLAFGRLEICLAWGEEVLRSAPLSLHACHKALRLMFLKYTFGDMVFASSSANLHSVARASKCG